MPTPRQNPDATLGGDGHADDRTLAPGDAETGSIRGEATIGPDDNPADGAGDRSDMTMPEGTIVAAGADGMTLGPDDAPAAHDDDRTLAPGDDPGMTLAPGGDDDSTIGPEGAADSDATMAPGSVADSDATMAPGEMSSSGTARLSQPPAQRPSSTAIRKPGEATSHGQTARMTSPASASKADRNKIPEVEGYEMLGELGRGGMGVVYRARQKGLNRMVALKMVLNNAASESELDRFRLEARAVALVQHPGIVQVFDVGEHNGLPYFSLEFVEGGPLDNRLKGEPQDAKFTASVMEKVCRAMGYAHSKKIIHRDLKPANILLTKTDEPKVTDFGLAKEMDSDEGHTRTGSIMGTPSYMPPEQAEGKAKHLNHLADIYSLGAMLYEFLTGRPPFKGRTLLETLEHVKKKDPVPPVQLQPDAPIDLQTICLKALEKDPAKRYQSADEMADDLAAFSRGDPIKARPISVIQKVIRWASRNKAQAALVAVASLFLLASLAGSVAINGLYAVAERQRKAREERRERDRSTAQKLFDDAQRDAAQARWPQARQNYDNALAAIRNDADLGDLRKQLEDGKAVADEHIDTDARLRTFREEQAMAIYELTNQSGRSAREGNTEARARAMKALEQFEVNPDAGKFEPVFGKHFSEKDKPEVRKGCAELLVVLADTWLDTDGEKSKALVTKARDEARRQGFGLEKAYLLKMIRYTTVAAMGKDEEYITKASKEVEALKALADKAVPQSAYEWFLVGDEQYKERNYAEASRSFQQAIMADPDDFFSHFFLGLSHLARDQFAAAQASFLAARAIRPDFRYTNLFLGVCAGKLGDNADAEKLLDDSGFSEDSRTALLVNRAAVRYDAGNHEKAIADLEAALKRQRSSTILVNLGTALAMGAKDPARAEPFLREAIRLDPNDGKGRRVLAKILADRADSDMAEGAKLRAEAIQLLRKAAPHLVGSPLAPVVDHEEGLLLLKSGDLPAAREAMARATAGNAKEARPWLDRGLVLFGMALESSRKQGKPDVALYKEAVECFDAYLMRTSSVTTADVRPLRGLALERKATALTILKDENGALAAQSEAVLVDPGQSSLRRMRGWNLMNGWRRLALADFEAGLRTDQGANRADLLMGRSYVLALEGKVEEALGALPEYEKASGGTPPMMLNFATVYAQAYESLRKAGNTAKAEEVLKAMTALIESNIGRVPAPMRARLWAAFRADEGFDPVRSLQPFKELDKKLSSAP